MNENTAGWGKFFLFLYISLAAALLLAYLFKSPSKTKQVERVKPEEVEEVFRTCYVPVPKAAAFVEDMKDYCDNPFLNRMDFLVERSLFSINSIEFKGKEMKLVEIKPYFIQSEEKKTVYFAFRKIATEVRKRGWYAVASCDGPTLKVGIPDSEMTGKGFINLIKLLPEKQ